MSEEVGTTNIIGTGSAAPDARLVDAAGSRVHLRQQWEAAPKALVLIFLRHFG